MSLRRLGLETIDLFQLHRIDPAVPLEDQIGELAKLQEEGKIRHIGLSEVDMAQLEAAQEIARIVSVQNRFNLIERAAEPVLDRCEAEGIAFIPWFPLATGALTKAGGSLSRLAASIGRGPAQLSLAWLLRRSPVMLPIPGTSSVGHLAENLGAAKLELSDEQFDALSALAADVR